MAKGLKTGGKIKGVSHNKPKPNIEVLTSVLGAYFDDTSKGVCQFASDLASLSPDERLSHIKDFMPYVYPKKQAIQVDSQLDVNVTIEQQLLSLM